MKETRQDTQEHYTISKGKDARTGHKSADSSFFGYKGHLAMTQERVITVEVIGNSTYQSTLLKNKKPIT